MPWFKLDDQVSFHAKTLAAGNEAFGAWSRAGAWSSGQLQNGRVPEATALTIAPMRVWKRLVDVGFAERIDGGWQIHDYLDWNPSADEVKARRDLLAQKRREAGNRGAVGRWQNGKPDGKPDGKPIANAMANGWQSDSKPDGKGHGKTMAPFPFPFPFPVPLGIQNIDPEFPGADPEPPLLLPPITAPPQKPAKAGKTQKGAAPLPEDWSPPRAVYVWARANEGVRFDETQVDYQLEKFRDHAATNGRVAKDWAAAFRTWLRNAREFKPELPEPAPPYREPPPVPPPNPSLMAYRAKLEAAGEAPPTFEESLAKMGATP